jgi:hypothetical protein
MSAQHLGDEVIAEYSALACGKEKQLAIGFSEVPTLSLPKGRDLYGFETTSGYEWLPLPMLDESASYVQVFFQFESMTRYDRDSSLRFGISEKPTLPACPVL